MVRFKIMSLSIGYTVRIGYILHTKLPKSQALFRFRKLYSVNIMQFISVHQ